MTNVTVTELNQRTRAVLDRVRAGERLTITDRGRPIAELVPQTTDRWEQLVAAGKVRPATERGPLPRLPARTDGPSTEEMMQELREDRF